ncbi:MAG: oxaloacetate decarboxylase [Dehalococcoidia bacterium]
MSKGKEFRQLLASEPYVFTSGVYCALDAKIAEMVGLKTVYMSGYSTSLAYLARADLGFPTMTEMAMNAHYIASATSIPVIADADDGYGNALITMRTVEEFERAGVAGIHIEDQRAPKRCGHMAGKYVLPLDEAVGKFKAAIRARHDPDFFIIARTDARGAVGGSLEEAIQRGKAYADAGVDMVWCEMTSPNVIEECEAFANEMQRAWPNLPLAFNYSSSFRWGTLERPLTFQALGEMGYKYIFITLGAPHASMYAVWNFLVDLKRNEEQAQLHLEKLIENHPTENHHRMGNFDYFQALEEEFLPADFVRGRYATSEGYGGADTSKGKSVLGTAQQEGLERRGSG